MAWIGAVIALAAAAAQQYNSNEVAKKQDRTAADAIRASSVKQRRADAAVNELVNQTEASTPKQSADNSLDQYRQAMLATTAGSNAGLNQQGNTSAEYKQGGADASLGIADYGSKFAGLMSRIDAPSQQRQKELLNQGQYATTIGMINRANAGDQYLSDLKLRGIKRDPWIDAAASAANAYAANYGGGGGGGMGTQVSQTSVGAVPQYQQTLQFKQPQTYAW